MLKNITVSIRKQRIRSVRERKKNNNMKTKTCQTNKHTEHKIILRYFIHVQMLLTIFCKHYIHIETFAIILKYLHTT